MNNRTFLVLKIISLLLVLLLAPSCKKDGPNTYRFCFSEGGGPLLYYDVDIYGATLSLRSGEEYAKPAIFSEDYATPNNSEWYTELDWIHVDYTPYTKELYIGVNENKSGKKRKATITANGPDGIVRVYITQIK